MIIVATGVSLTTVEVFSIFSAYLIVFGEAFCFSSVAVVFAVSL